MLGWHTAAVNRQVDRPDQVPSVEALAVLWPSVERPGGEGARAEI